jgi:hypothetical protein
MLKDLTFNNKITGFSVESRLKETKDGNIKASWHVTTSVQVRADCSKRDGDRQSCFRTILVAGPTGLPNRLNMR